MKKLLLGSVFWLAAFPALAADNILFAQPNGVNAIISSTESGGVQTLNVTCPTCSTSAITALTGDVTATGPGSVAATLTTAQPGAHTWAALQTLTLGFRANAASGLATGAGTPFPTTPAALEISSSASTPPSMHGANGSGLHITGASGGNIEAGLDAFGGFGIYSFRRTNGTPAAPTQVLAGEQIGDIANYVRDDAGFTNGTTGIQFFALNTQTTTDHSSYVRFVTVDSGSTTRVATMVLKANNTILGDIDAAAAVAQTLSAQSVATTVTSNAAGATLTIKGSAGTGTGVGGVINIQTAPAGSSGSTQNTFSTVLSINSVKATGTSVSPNPGQVSIGTTSPTAMAAFTISMNAAAPPSFALLSSNAPVHLVGTDAAVTRLHMDSFAASSLISFRRADTTNASPSGLVAADQIGGFQWAGFAGASTSAYVAQRATFDAIAEATWTNTDQSTSFRFFTTATGSISQTQKMRLWASGGLAVGAANVATDPAAGGVLATTLAATSTTRLSSGFTIGTLPTAGTAGRTAYVTDQLTTCAVAGAALTAGGSVVCPVFDNGVAWVGL